jgi:hypothetical protein
MRIIVGIWDLQINVRFLPRGEAGIVHIPKVLSLVEMNVLIYLTKDQTQNSLNESAVSSPGPLASSSKSVQV